MTVSYTYEVANCKGFGCFWKLLFRWKASLYKLVWKEMIVYSIFFYALSITYRKALNEDNRRTFERICIYCEHFTELIPISFVLGFYVSIVVTRWWTQYETLPWPDSLALYISTFLVGHDDKGRMMRRTIVRYANLAFIITLTMISPRAKKRFPTHDHLVDAGLLTPSEKHIFEETTANTSYSLYWMPLVWAGTIISRARREGRIRDDFAVKSIIDEVNRTRGLCGRLLSYDWISIPLVYTQVVTLAVYTFFLSTLMGRQFLDPSQNIKGHEVDFYFPIFTYLQFFFYMGWLKVAETLVNPFGEDDDDFEVNYLIDRNVKVSYLIVDEMHNEHPELVQDIYWDEVFPEELPYTLASGDFRANVPMGSTARIEVPLEKQEILPTLDEEDDMIEKEIDDSCNDDQGKKILPPIAKKSATLRQITSNLSGLISNIGRRASAKSATRSKKPSTSSSRRPASRKSIQSARKRHSVYNLDPSPSEENIATELGDQVHGLSTSMSVASKLTEISSNSSPKINSSEEDSEESTKKENNNLNSLLDEQ